MQHEGVAPTLTFRDPTVCSHPGQGTPVRPGGASLRREEIVANWERARKSDGTVGDVDFSAQRWTGVLELLNDPAYLALVMVDTEAGTISWPDGIDLAPETVYEQARAHPLVAA